MKIRLLLLIPLLWHLTLRAQSLPAPSTEASPPVSYLTATRQAYFKKLNSPFMEVIEESNRYFDEQPGDYPLLAKLIQFDFLKWDPSGQSKRNIKICDPHLWQKKILESPLEPEVWNSELEKFIGQCAAEWETSWKGVLPNSLGTVSLKLHPSRYPYGRHVLFHLPNHVLLKGLLAMKPDEKKRPLIIFRTGMFSNSQEFFPERFLFLQMFEQSPFNILVLESLSGSEYLKHNDSYSLGGFDEGLQEFLIAQKLQMPEEPISKSIDSVHLMGMSMGGHGVLFAALLNQLNPGPNHQPVIQSALTFCPLLNMQETLEYHKSQGFAITLMNYWASRRLSAARTKWPELRDDNFVPQYFDLIQKNYHAPVIAENGKLNGIRLPPEMEEVLSQNNSQAELYWKLNNYWPWYLKVQTPVLMFSTRQDPIVTWSLNAGRLESGKMKFENSNVKMISFPEGIHCSFPVAYDWGAMATIFQTAILRYSPHFKQQTKEVSIPLSAEVLADSQGRSPTLHLSFDIHEEAAGIFATVQFAHQLWFSFEDWLLAPRMTVQLPLADMEFPIDQIVRSADEASLLKRWAYQNIEARIERGHLIFSWKVTAP